MTVLAALPAVLLALAAAAAIVAVLGMAISADVFGRLLYGSIPSGFCAVAVAVAVILAEKNGTTALQMIAFALLLAVSGAITGHRIAAAAEARRARRQARSGTPAIRKSRLSRLCDWFFQDAPSGAGSAGRNAGRSAGPGPKKR